MIGSGSVTANAFPVGDPRRRALGRATYLALLVGTLFVGFTVWVKDNRSLSEFAPWAEDPYDAFFSFGIFFVALVAGISLVRVRLSRESEPLPISRVLGLVRGSKVILGTIIVTFGAAWVSVLVTPPSRVWTAPTSQLVVFLMFETILAGVAVVALLKAAGPFGKLGELQVKTSGPDWLDDAMTLAAFAARRMGPAAPLGGRLVGAGDRLLVTRIRRHRLRAAFVLAGGFGAFFATGAALEGDPGLLVLLVGIIGAGAIFAFVVAAGSYLQIVRGRPSEATVATSRRPLILAAVAASANVPVALAFRDSLWWLVGSTADEADISQLAALLGLVGLATFLIVMIIGLVVHRHTPR